MQLSKDSDSRYVYEGKNGNDSRLGRWRWRGFLGVLLAFGFSLLFLSSNMARADWTAVPGAATDIGVGADGSVWIIGANDPDPNGGRFIYKWTGSAWQQVGGLAVRIAVDPKGNPWVVNSGGSIFRWLGNDQWQTMPGLATDIGVGADGSVWIIGANDPDPNGGRFIYKWTGTNWQQVGGLAVRIAVDPKGNPWVVNSGGSIFRWLGNDQWQTMPGLATDIGVGADGSVWIIGANDPDPNGGRFIYKWTGTAWQQVGGLAVSIAVDPKGNPWVVNSGGAIFRETTAVAGPAPAPANGAPLPAMANEFVAAHNRHRAKKNVPPLTWAADLANTAQDWADGLTASKCGVISHRPNNPLGENIAMAAASPNPPSKGPTWAVDDWASEEQFYDYASNTCAGTCGHYTQIVWANSKEVGCGESSCVSDEWNYKVWVCNYRPAGNLAGQKPY